MPVAPLARLSVSRAWKFPDRPTDACHRSLSVRRAFLALEDSKGSGWQSQLGAAPQRIAPHAMSMATLRKSLCSLSSNAVLAGRYIQHVKCGVAMASCNTDTSACVPDVVATYIENARQCNSALKARPAFVLMQEYLLGPIGIVRRDALARGLRL